MTPSLRSPVSTINMNFSCFSVSDEISFSLERLSRSPTSTESTSSTTCRNRDFSGSLSKMKSGFMPALLSLAIFSSLDSPISLIPFSSKDFAISGSPQTTLVTAATLTPLLLASSTILPAFFAMLSLFTST